MIMECVSRKVWKLYADVMMATLVLTATYPAMDFALEVTRIIAIQVSQIL